jgi:hypothetical protein
LLQVIYLFKGKGLKYLQKLILIFSHGKCHLFVNLSASLNIRSETSFAERSTIGIPFPGCVLPPVK